MQSDANSAPELLWLPQRIIEHLPVLRETLFLMLVLQIWVQIWLLLFLPWSMLLSSAWHPSVSHASGRFFKPHWLLPSCRCGPVPANCTTLSTRNNWFKSELKHQVELEALSWKEIWTLEGKKITVFIGSLCLGLQQPYSLPEGEIWPALEKIREKHSQAEALTGQKLCSDSSVP